MEQVGKIDQGLFSRLIAIAKKTNNWNVFGQVFAGAEILWPQTTKVRHQNLIYFVKIIPKVLEQGDPRASQRTHRPTPLTCLWTDLKFLELELKAQMKWRAHI
jgi:hypothetical protein